MHVESVPPSRESVVCLQLLKLPRRDGVSHEDIMPMTRIVLGCANGIKLTLDQYTSLHTNLAVFTQHHFGFCAFLVQIEKTSYQHNLTTSGYDNNMLSYNRYSCSPPFAPHLVAWLAELISFKKRAQKNKKINALFISYVPPFRNLFHSFFAFTSILLIKHVYVS